MHVKFVVTRANNDMCVLLKAGSKLLDDEAKMLDDMILPSSRDE